MIREHRSNDPSIGYNGGRDRARHRKRAESTLRPVPVAGSLIGHGCPA